MAARRTQQAASAAQANGAADAPLASVLAQEQLLQGSGLLNLHALIRDVLRPALAAEQRSGSCSWGLALADESAGVPVDTIVLDEAGCAPDFTLPLLLSLRASNLVRLLV